MRMWRRAKSEARRGFDVFVQERNTQCISGADLDSCRHRVGVAILGIWLVQMLARLRFQVLHVDAEKNWA